MGYKGTLRTLPRRVSSTEIEIPQQDAIEWLEQHAPLITRAIRSYRTQPCMNLELSRRASRVMRNFGNGDPVNGKDIYFAIVPIVEAYTGD